MRAVGQLTEHPEPERKSRAYHIAAFEDVFGNVITFYEDINVPLSVAAQSYCALHGVEQNLSVKPFVSDIISYANAKKLYDAIRDAGMHLCEIKKFVRDSIAHLKLPIIHTHQDIPADSPILN